VSKFPHPRHVKHPDSHPSLRLEAVFPATGLVSKLLEEPGRQFARRLSVGFDRCLSCGSSSHVVRCAGGRSSYQWVRCMGLTGYDQPNHNSCWKPHFWAVCAPQLTSSFHGSKLTPLCFHCRLYTCSVPLIAYSLLATSRLQVSGPAAVDSILTYSAVGTLVSLKTADPSQVPMLDIHSLSLILSKLWYVQLVLAAQALAVMVGLIQVGLGVLKLGILANFLSYPVLTGFINGAAITIIISQVQVCVSLLLSRTDNHESFTWVSRLAVDSIFSEFLESQSIQELRQVS
jgi:hypothetical protein